MLINVWGVGYRLTDEEPTAGMTAGLEAGGWVVAGLTGLLALATPARPSRTGWRASRAPAMNCAAR